jgi:type I site-specific restriction endonuclease
VLKHEGRKKFIRNLVLSLEGNTIVLFERVDTHGKIMYDDLVKHAAAGRKIFYVSGETETAVREEVRRIVEQEDNAIITASAGTFGTGVNIKRIHNAVLTTPMKDQIRIPQFIGRTLRLGEGKDEATFFDIVDDIRHKDKENYLLNTSRNVSLYTTASGTYTKFTISI